MSENEQVRLFMSLAFGAALSIGLYLQVRKREPYTPLISPLALLATLPALMVLGLLTGVEDAAARLCLQMILQVSVYFAVLLLFLPLLRRVVRPSTVAMLWLLPNYLYLTCNVSLWRCDPKVVLPVPAALTWRLPLAWGLGFLAVMGRAVIRHVLFRRQLLRGAAAVTEPEILAVWSREKEAVGLENAALPLVRSAATATPLSIGVWQRTTRVVLPERAYTPQELALIFRHELIHIRHRDAAAKLFLTFCQAVCWFNPLMWVAMRKCADDLELSCDELALADADDGTREAYARLVLRTAGDERGFTTCLSVKAQALRYRLRGIVARPRRLTGGVLVGALLSLLLFSSGTVALAYSPAPAGEVLFHGRSAAYTPSAVSVTPDPQWYPNREVFYRCTDGAALTRYLSGLTLYRTSSLNDQPRENGLYIRLDDGERVVALYLYDHLLDFWRGAAGDEHLTCYFPEELDRGYLMSLLEPLPEE